MGQIHSRCSLPHMASPGTITATRLHRWHTWRNDAHPPCQHQDFCKQSFAPSLYPDHHSSSPKGDAARIERQHLLLTTQSSLHRATCCRQPHTMWAKIQMAAARISRLDPFANHSQELRGRKTRSNKNMLRTDMLSTLSSRLDSYLDS